MSCVGLEKLDLVTLGIQVDVSKLLDAYYILLWCEIGSYMFSSTDLLLTYRRNSSSFSHLFHYMSWEITFFLGQCVSV